MFSLKRREFAGFSVLKISTMNNGEKIIKLIGLLFVGGCATDGILKCIPKIFKRSFSILLVSKINC